MIKINLLADRESAKREGARRMIVVLVATFSVLIVLMAVTHGCLSRKAGGLQDRIDQLIGELEILQKSVGEVDDFKEQKRALEEKLNVITLLEKNKSGPVRILSELGMQIPDSIWLNSLRKAGDSIEMKGVAMDNESIARFMRNLESSSYFKDVELLVTEHYEVSGLGLKKFSISSRAEHSES